MPEDLADLSQRGASGQHVTSGRVAQAVGAHHADPGTASGAGDDTRHPAAGQAPPGPLDADEDLPAGGRERPRRR